MPVVTARVPGLTRDLLQTRVPGLTRDLLPTADTAGPKKDPGHAA